MDRETKKIIIVVAVAAVVLLSAYAGLRAYSGVNPPFTVINSGSMMHSSESEIGIIDTGDMLLVKDPDSKSVTTYVEGSKNGYRQFGEYGDVIVYMKPNQNIIHRAMIYLELSSNSGGTLVWHIPSLEGYDNWNMTNSAMFSEDTTYRDALWNPDTCELTLTSSESGYFFWLTDVGYGELNVPINLYTLGKDASAGYSGYLTKGDNASTNTRFDQTSGIYENKLVEEDVIKSVAVFEIPWLGSVKLLLNGHGDNLPGNSLRNLAISFVLLIAFIVAMDFLITYITRKVRENRDGRQ